ncbi:MAG: M23 family metallopeptidase, partial [Bacteroidaceae bacterium]
KVRVVKYEARGYGNYIVIRHPNGLETIYGHLSKWLVKPNEEVASGEPIGLGGSTGRSTGSHLHFETRFMGQALNPQLLFDFPNQDVTGDFYAYGSGVSRNLPDDAVAENREAKQHEIAESSPYHKVQRGETLYRIAKENGISIDKLCQLNGLKKTTKLRPGQVLRCS